MNFTPRAQQVLALARREADRLNHDYVGPEHLLLGIARLDRGVAIDVIARMAIDPVAIRAEIEKAPGGPERKIIGHFPYNPEVKRLLALAGVEAKDLHHSYVGTEHILLGLLREEKGVAARVLSNLGVNIERARYEILKELDPSFTPEPANLSPPAPPFRIWKWLLPWKR